MKQLFIIAISLFIVNQSFAQETLPTNHPVFLGDLPNGYSPPEYTTVFMGRRANLIKEIEGTLATWMQNTQIDIINSVGNKKHCTENGYQFSATSNFQISFEQPLTHYYVFLFRYNVHCWGKNQIQPSPETED